MRKGACIGILALIVLTGGTPRADAPKAAPHTPTMAQFMSPAFPLDLVAARKADRIAWIANDKGLRNWTLATGSSLLWLEAGDWELEAVIETAR
jgi:hypothetical protein